MYVEKNENFWKNKNQKLSLNLILHINIKSLTLGVYKTQKQNYRKENTNDE